MHKWLYASHDIIIARFVYASFHVSNSALCTTVLSIPIDVVLTFSISYEDFGTWSMQVSKALGYYIIVSCGMQLVTHALDTCCFTKFLVDAYNL